MALNWEAAAVGFAHGAVGGYNDFKEQQKIWEKEQMSKDADAARELHYQGLEREAAFKHSQSSEVLRAEEAAAHRATKQQIDSAQAQTDASRADYMSPAAAAHRERMTDDKIESELKVADALKAKVSKDVEEAKVELAEMGYPESVIKQYEANKKYGLDFPKKGEKLTADKRNEIYVAAQKMATDKNEAMGDTMTPEDLERETAANVQLMMSSFATGDEEGGGGMKPKDPKAVTHAVAAIQNGQTTLEETKLKVAPSVYQQIKAEVEGTPTDGQMDLDYGPSRPLNPQELQAQGADARTSRNIRRRQQKEEARRNPEANAQGMLGA